ncbi:MAG TPA: cupredoxin domain-containing protein [Solirubrobacterales bacterium]|nr:cupredoxin domain-containing protein [Solirubrobacterales bacterium]
MKRNRFLVLGLAVALAILATVALRHSDAGAATASAAKSVVIRDFAFHPGTLKVKRGARVAFTNSSNVTHTATKGGAFDTRGIAPGKSATVAFNKRGTFAYHCKIHPFMKGKVVVE